MVPVNGNCNGQRVATYALFILASDKFFCERQLITQFSITPSLQCKIALLTLLPNRSKMVGNEHRVSRHSPLKGGTYLSVNNVIVLDQIAVQPRS